MRRPETLLVVAFVGLFAVVMWQGPHWFQGQTIQAAPAIPVVFGRQVAKAAKPDHGSVAKNSGRRYALPVTDEPEAFPPALDSATKHAKPLLAVPDAEKLPIGTTRSELREHYAVPTFTVEAVRDGSFVERYYYVKPDRDNMVVATLLDGKLVSAETAKYLLPKRTFTAKFAQ